MTANKRGGRSCDTCHWFAPATEEMKQRFFPHDGTCEIRFPHEGFSSRLESHECGNRVDEAEEPEDLIEIRAKGAPGGGGTSFVPVFDEIYNSGLRPDALVYLTDGYGSFPDKAPPYSVIWGSIGLDKSGYPFGDVVMIPTSS